VRNAAERLPFFISLMILSEKFAAVRIIY